MRYLCLAASSSSCCNDGCCCCCRSDRDDIEDTNDSDCEEGNTTDVPGCDSRELYVVSDNDLFITAPTLGESAVAKPFVLRRLHDISLNSPGSNSLSCCSCRLLILSPAVPVDLCGLKLCQGARGRYWSDPETTCVVGRDIDGGHLRRIDTVVL